MAISQNVTNEIQIKYIDYHWLWLQRSIRTMMWCDLTRPTTSIAFSNLSIPPKNGLAKGRGLIQNTVAPSFFVYYIHIWCIYIYYIFWFDISMYDGMTHAYDSNIWPHILPLTAVTKRLQKACETSYRRRKKMGEITGNTQQPNSNCPICWFPIYLMLYVGGWCLRVK